MVPCFPIEFNSFSPSMSLRVPWCDGDLIGDNFQGDLLVSMSSDSVPMGINLSFMLLSSLCIDTHHFYFMCMSVLAHARCMWRAEEDVRSPGTFEPLGISWMVVLDQPS